MNELIKVDCSGEQMKVSARDLHEFLDVDTEYRHWFPRMCEYGFADGVDFNTVKKDRVRFEGNRQVTRQIEDAIMSMEMAKEICMVTRNEKGKIARQYFLQLEKDWNSPEKVMARALKFADQTINQLNQTIAIMEPKARYYDIVLACKDLVPTTIISKDYGWSATKLNRWLNENGYQYRRGNTWVLYEKYADKGYTSSKTHVYEDKSGREHSTMQTQWTQAGRLFVYNELKKRGILPMIEQDTMQERM